MVQDHKPKLFCNQQCWIWPQGSARGRGRPGCKGWSNLGHFPILAVKLCTENQKLIYGPAKLPEQTDWQFWYQQWSIQPQVSARGLGGSRVQRLIKSGPLHYLGNQALHRKPIIGHVVPYGFWIIQLTILLVSVPDLTPGLCSVCGGHRGVRMGGIWSNLQAEYHNFAEKTNTWSHGPACSQVDPVDYFTNISTRFDPRFVQCVCFILVELVCWKKVDIAWWN